MKNLLFSSGAFLIPYAIFMLIEGLPLFFLELSIGQRMRKSAINCWRDVHPALFGIGVACMMVSLMLCLYYVVVIAWCCYYFFISFTSTLPWEAESLCPKYAIYKGIKDALLQCEKDTSCKNSTRYFNLKSNESNFPDCCVRDPPQYYFYYHALQISSSIEDPGVGINGKLAGCLVFAWIVTYLCVVKGIQSSGKVTTSPCYAVSFSYFTRDFFKERLTGSKYKSSKAKLLLISILIMPCIHIICTRRCASHHPMSNR